MNRHPARNRLLIFVPFLIAGIVVSSFIASRAYLTRYLARLSQASSSLVSTTVPALEPLTQMRLELHRIGSFGQSEPAAITAAARAKVVRDARTQLNRWFAAYSRLPQHPNETLLRISVEAELERLNRACGRALASAASSASGEPAPEDLAALREATEVVTFAVANELEVAVRETNEANRALIEARSSAVSVRRVLDILCYAAAGLGALLSAVLIHRHLKLAALYSELQETKVRELELFSGRVAHDIMGPLQPVALCLEMLQRRLRTDGPSQEVFTRAQRSFQRVRLIVDGLLAFARAGARPAPDERSRLSEVLDEVRADLLPSAEQVGVELRIEPAPAIDVACTEAGITVLLENLILNAIKYVGEQGQRWVTARAEVGETSVRLVVQDSGPGLPPGMEQTIFEPYVRGRGVRQAGIGLGLATVKRIAEAHGGRVGVKSRPGAGATFWVELPRVARARAA